MNWLNQDSDTLMAPSGLSFLGATPAALARQAEAKAKREAAQAQRQAAQQVRQQTVQANQAARQATVQQHQQAAAAAKATRQAATAANKTEKLSAAQTKKAAAQLKQTTNQINAEIKRVQQQINNAKAKGVDVPEWITYLECLKSRLIDASKVCQKPTGTVAQAIAKAKKAPAAAKEDVAKLRATDSAESAKLSAMKEKLKTSMKDRVINLAKNPRTKPRALQLAQKYCLTIGVNNEVTGVVCVPPAIAARASQAASKGKARRKGMRGMGDDFDGVQNPEIEPFGPEIGGGGTNPPVTGDTYVGPTGELGVSTVGGEDMDCSVLLLALGGEVAADPKCAKRPNKPVCMMARMQEEQKQQFALLVLFLCEMINDLKTSISSVPVYDPNTQFDPNTVPYYDPSMDAGGGMVLGPTDDSGLIDTSGYAEEGGASEMVTGPMPSEAGDESYGAEESFEEAWPMPMTQPSMQPAAAMQPQPPVVQSQPAFDEFGEGNTTENWGGDESFMEAASDGFSDEGESSDTLDFESGEAGLFGLGCNGKKKCRKCNKK